MSSLQRIKGRDIPRDRWDHFVRSSPEGMLYALHAFLSGIDEEWEAWISSKGDEWQMVFPFIRSKKWGVRYFLQPRFTQFLGPMFRPFSSKRSVELTSKNQLLTELCAQLKKDFTYLNFNLHSRFDYPLPFNWSGFRTRPLYTYQIQLQNRSLEELKAGIHPKMKSHINRALENGCSFKEGDDAGLLLSLFSAHKGQSISHIKDQHYTAYAQLLQSYIRNGDVKLFELYDAGKELVGGMILYVFGSTCTYAFSVARPDFQDLSPGYGLIWKAMEWAVEQNLELLDFEGSMIPEIERVFRRFGADPVAYLNVQYARFPFLYRH